MMTFWDYYNIIWLILFVLFIIILPTIQRNKMLKKDKEEIEYLRSEVKKYKAILNVRGEE